MRRQIATVDPYGVCLIVRVAGVGVHIDGRFPINNSEPIEI
jgi:hypothetical protein